MSLTWGGQEFRVEPITNYGRVAPTVNDTTIFVSLVSYRDGERCGATLKSIFETAKHPEKVFVGIVEQNTPDDVFCIEEYCKEYGAKVITRDIVREGTTKITRVEDEKEVSKCPRLDQVGLLGIHHFAAKGPMYARSLQRKLLGNQEFCLQLDSHSQVTRHWDEGLMTEWQSTRNDFAVLSTLPPDVKDMVQQQPGGSSETRVPRQCSIRFQENGVPDYDGMEQFMMDGSKSKAYVEGLHEPLLSVGWSAAFSFAKCHLEEAVPYDPFVHYSKPVEQFGRFARMWTRGYDVYTPTRNYVFHDYGPQPNGHGDNEWFKRQKQRFRIMAIDRIKLLLELPLSQESDTENVDRANLGIYGLGQRRTLEQFEEFCNVKLQERKGNILESGGKCAGKVMVPYDVNISPMANLHHVDGILTKLDPSPVFPLRSRPTFATQNIASSQSAGDKSLDPENLEISVDADAEADVNFNSETKNAKDGSDLPVEPHVGIRHILLDPRKTSLRPGVGSELLEQTNMPPTSVLFILWIFGLIVWCFVFSVQNTSDAWSPASTNHMKTKKTASLKKQKKTKIVKDV